MNLIYDRTAEDVERALALAKKAEAGTLTDAEKTEWLAGMKGCYNATDMNRVEAAVKTLAAELNAAGYAVEVGNTHTILPAGYQRLEYIESTGTQYIDTGVSAPAGCRLKCKIAFTELTSTLSVIFGSHDAASPYYRNFLAANTSLWEIGAYGTADFGLPSIDTIFDIDVNTKSGEIGCTINGTAYDIDQSIAPSSTRSSLSVYLFALHYADGLFASKLKSYGWQMYVDDILVRDFIPCKNPSGAVGLYDLVGGEFYTTPTAVTLPAGYTRIEYLQSSGTQHIDTGFKPNNNSKIVTTLQFVSSSSGNRFCLGARTSNNVGRFSLGYSFGSGGGWFFGHGASVTTVNTTSSPTDKTSVVIDKNVCTIAGQSATATPSTFSTTQNLVLFADNEGGKVGQNGAIKLYDCSIYDNGTLVRNFVPARNSSGTLGLYDTANGIFYTNQGSGTFTAGADIVGFTAGAEVGKAEDREWQEGDVVRRAQWTTYLDNVQRLRDAYYTLAETGALPAPGDKLTYTGANTIEKILADIDLLLDGMKSIYRRAGTFTAGGSYTRQMIRSI